MDIETDEEKDERGFSFTSAGQKIEYDLTGVVNHHFKSDMPINIDPFLYDYSPRKTKEKWS